MGEMKNLKKLRVERNLSQEQAAEQMGLDRAKYQRYESGANKASYDVLRLFARFFHTSIDYLLEYEPEEYPKELAYVMSRDDGGELGQKPGYDLKIPSTCEDLDGGLIHLIECYRICEDEQRKNILYMVDQIATGLLAKKKQEEKG